MNQIMITKLSFYLNLCLTNLIKKILNCNKKLSNKRTLKRINRNKRFSNKRTLKQNTYKNKKINYLLKTKKYNKKTKTSKKKLKKIKITRCKVILKLKDSLKN